MNFLSFNGDLERFLASLTHEPGVYRMLDAEQTVLYVGKAANLKKRVASYFKQKHLGVKTRALMQQVASVEVSVTRSETEALLLECSLIKSLKPKYNVLMRDDKSYPYLRITKHPVFPRMDVVRAKKKPKDAELFGPYPSTRAVRDTLKIMQKVFKLRNCSDVYFNQRTRPCLQYQIDRCSAPCTAYISKEDYQQSVRDAARFLEGKSQEIIDAIGRRMDAAALNLDFEQAARLRDQIKNLRAIQEQQGMVCAQGDADVIAIEVHPGLACVQWVSIRDGQILGNQSFFPAVPSRTFEISEAFDPDSLRQQVFVAFMSHFYLDAPERIPPLILSNHTLEDRALLESLLSQFRTQPCRIQTVNRGIKKRWIDFACDNLQRAIAEHQSSHTLIQARVEALLAFLNLPGPTLRMACFDISHTQGSDTIASCVVFDENGPDKSQYRRYAIQNITPGDDYAAMAQALTRRFKPNQNHRTSLPDVLIVDGGKGQVKVALEVLQSLEIHGVKLLGIAKGASRKAGWERLILADHERELTLPPDSKALHLIQHIRDEAHRFAITLHRKKRAKTSLDASLVSIEGIGAKRRQALLKRFGGMRELARAPIEEIAKVQGISQQLAIRIHRHFQQFKPV